jgi:biuret amidohydrolase
MAGEVDSATHDRFYDYDFSFAPTITLRPDSHTALLVIDMQYHDASPDHGFNLAVERIEPGSLAYYNRRVEDTVVPSIVELVRYFRSRAMPTVYVTLGSDYSDYRDFSPRGRAMIQDLEHRSGVRNIFWSGDPGFAIRSEIAPADGDIIVRKRTAGAFNSSNIDEVLRTGGIENLVITGVTTSCCVDSTARDAADRGFGCVMVDEATAEYDPEAHDATRRTFHGNFGRVVRTAADVIEAVETVRPL